jgi:hypothetical protein
VLVDSTAPRPGSDVPASRTDGVAGRLLTTVLPAAAHLGLARLVAHFSYASLPAPTRAEAISRAARAANVRSVVEELEAGTAAVHQAAACVDLHDTPLIVLTAGQEHDAAWMADQDRLAALSTLSQHRVVAGATHAGLVDEEEGVAATTRAIRDVVAAARS